PQVALQWIRPLEVGQSHVLGEEVTVTLLDSNHCPGSVMFLFEGAFGTILYTGTAQVPAAAPATAPPAHPDGPVLAGDFRYTSAMKDEPLLTGRHVDRLYLDNTHCDPQQALPSRQQATHQAASIIRAHPQHHVVIGMYTLGKESLLVDLAMEFNAWVVVSPWRLKQMQLLELPDVFTTEEGASWIRAVDIAEIRRDTLISWNALHPTIAILPTGRSLKVTHPNIHLIPYSDHSSFSELCEFVKWLKPCSVIPIVKGDKCQGYFQQYLSSAPQALPNLKIPKPVQESARQKCKGKGQEPKSVPKSATWLSVARGVVYEPPEKCTETSEELAGVEVPQQKHCKSALCSREGCACHKGGEKERGREKERGQEKVSEQPGVAGAGSRAGSAGSQASVSDKHLPTGLAQQYLLTPLHVLKKFSPQGFDKAVEDFRRREAP
ncbi:DCR1B exonuclease, partial [Rhynochetos jubatus]|nr:DCR1B exonuclease [Rhynochetos jubatus]